MTAGVGDMLVAAESLFEEAEKFLRSHALQLLLNFLMRTVSILLFTAVPVTLSHTLLLV